MQKISIFRGADLLTEIKPNDDSVLIQKIMGENECRISFSSSIFFDFKIGDKALVFGKYYYMNQLPMISKESTRMYKYDFTFQSSASILSRIQYLFLGDDNSLKEPDFSLTGTIDVFLSLILQNVSRINDDFVFTLGEVVTDGSFKTITFNTQNCLDALGTIAEAFETEYFIDDFKILITKRQKDTGYSFKVGRYNGLYDLTRKNIDSENLVTRLYCFGSEKNLPEGYRNYSKRLKFDELFVEKNVSTYGLIESTAIFDDIFPHRTGNVTSINAGDYYEFSDSGIDFDVNDYLLPGMTAKITFNTGQLSGYTFEVRSFNFSTKKFIILKNKNERTIDIPNSSIRPAIGDSYVITDITMPEIYITNAENELKAKSQELLDRISTPQLSYDLTIDPVFIKSKNISISLGDLVWIIDENLQLQRKIRVIGLEREIVNENKYRLEISDVLTQGKIDALQSGQGSIQNSVNNLNSNFQNNSILNNRVIGDLILSPGSTIKFEDISSASGITLLGIGSDGKIYKLE